MPRETVNLDVEKFRDELITRKISISELEIQCYFTKGYINQVINKNGKLLNLKYNQIIKVLNLPYGALLSTKHNVPNVSGAGRVLVDYEYIKSYLKLKGMTMKELSYNLNWSTGYLNKMNSKSGSTIPNIRYKQLTDFLDVPYETFLVNKSKPEPEPEPRIIIHGHSAICQALDSENTNLIHKINHLHRTMGEMIIKLEENNKLIHTYSDYENSKGDNLNG